MSGNLDTLVKKMIVKPASKIEQDKFVRTSIPVGKYDEDRRKVNIDLSGRQVVSILNQLYRHYEKKVTEESEGEEAKL